MLGDAVERRLARLRSGGEVGDAWLRRLERQLRAALEFFGTGRLLHSITSREFKRYRRWLSGRSNGRGGHLSEATVEGYMKSLRGVLGRDGLGRRVLRGRRVTTRPGAAAYPTPLERRLRRARRAEREGSALPLGPPDGAGM